MGQLDRQPAEATAQTLGGIPIKSGPITIGLACLTVSAWTVMAITLAYGAENRWTLATVGIAATITIATITAKAVEVVGIMLNQHAERMAAITQAHSQDLRSQVFNLNWLMTSAAWGEQRAKIEATRMYESRGPADTGPFTIINGAG